MKILIVSNLFPPEVLGGYEILCQQVCRGLKGEGHQVKVLTTPSRSPDEREWVVRDLRLFLPFAQPASGRYRLRQAHCYHHNQAVTRRVIEEMKPDVVFVWSQRRLTLACARAAQEMGFPVAYTLNDEYLDFYRPAPFTGRLSLEGLDLSHTTCISQKLKSNLLNLGLPLEQSKVIYQGVPLERFPLRQETVSQPQNFLYVGQLHSYKGVHTAIEAAHLSDVSLTVVGGGSPGYEGELRRLALSGPARVRFLGRLSPDQVAACYREHDALIFPSSWEEPFGLTHLEAMASGLPVISTTNGGQGEFLASGFNCLDFRPGDAIGLAFRILKLQSEPGLAARLAAAGRRTVEERFSLNGYLNQLSTFLQEVA